MTPTEIALAAMAALFTNYDADAARDLLAPDYIQHNPAVPTGADPIIGFIPTLGETGMTADIHRVITEDNLVVLHTTYNNAQAFGADALIGFDVFRIEDGKVAEHWDNLQIPAGPNPSGRSMVDGPVAITDLDKTAENKALVTDFVDQILTNGDIANITNFIAPTQYIQHNPNIGDGLDGLGTALAQMAEQGIALQYTSTPLIVAEGNFVFTGSEGFLGETPTAFFDLFRVENGKIVEHWDVVSDIPAEMAHENGKF